MGPLMNRIAYKPHKKRVKEARFASALMVALPEADHMETSSPLHADWLDYLVDTESVIGCLRRDSCLPPRRREEAIRILLDLPHHLKVALTPKRISCDVTVELDGTQFYYEFHEVQHRKLTVNRPSPIYSEDGTKYDVPRFLQSIGIIKGLWGGHGQVVAVPFSPLFSVLFP